MKYARLALFAIGIVFIIQMTGYIILKDRALFEYLPHELESELPDIEIKTISVICCNCLLDDGITHTQSVDHLSQDLFDNENKELFRQSLSSAFDEVIFINSRIETETSVKQAFVLNYFLCYNTDYFLCSTEEDFFILDNDGTSYEHSYSRKLIWIFFGWLEIEKNTNGIS